MTDEPKHQEFHEEKRREPIFSLPAVIVVLAVLMLLIQAAQSFVLNEAAQAELLGWLAFVPVRILAADHIPGGIWPLLWTPFTYGFVHAGWEHVVGNVLWMVIFGTPVARRYGWRATLIVFFVSSLVGAIAFGITEYNTVAYLVGASGGVAGLTGAAMRFIFQPVIVGPHPETGEPVALGRKTATIPEMLRSAPVRTFSLIWIGLNCLAPLAPLIIGQDVEIAWQAHLGGFFTGLLLVPFFEHPDAGRAVRPEEPKA